MITTERNPTMPRRTPPTLDIAESPLDDTGKPIYDRPSKTRLKTQAHDLQALGRSLSELRPDQLANMAMAEPLRDALLELKRTKSHEGKRRQMQLVGKLMRHSEAEPLREAVAALKLGRAEDSLSLHKAEYWREALVNDETAITRFAQEHSDIDLQQVRALVRRARQEKAEQPSTPEGDTRHGKAWRELFKLIRPYISA